MAAACASEAGTLLAGVFHGGASPAFFQFLDHFVIRHHVPYLVALVSRIVCGVVEAAHLREKFRQYLHRVMKPVTLAKGTRFPKGNLRIIVSPFQRLVAIVNCF